MATRRKYTSEFKAKVVLEILTEHMSLAQASREYGIKDTVLSRWKQDFLRRSHTLFEHGQAKDEKDRRIAELERMVGRLAMEIEMVKKVSKYLDSP